MALLLTLFAICAGCMLLTAVYPPFFMAALASLLLLLIRVLRILRQSQTDPLTGLYNLRYLNAMKKHYHKCASLCVFYLDIDGLKSVNDTQGHAAGDRLLLDLAAFLQSQSIGCADAYRIGGDEFLLIFKTDSPDDFLTHLNRANIPASCGFASGPGHTLVDLISSAEQEMYASRKVR